MEAGEAVALKIFSLMLKRLENTDSLAAVACCTSERESVSLQSAL